MPESPQLHSDGVLNLRVFSDGTQLHETCNIVSVTVSKALNRIPSARIILLDGDMPDQEFPLSNENTFKPGNAIIINAGYADNDEPIFQGIIVKHSIKISANNYSRLVIDCRDKAMCMTIGRKNANFTDTTDSDLITELIGRHDGLATDVESTSVSYTELVQYYCSDWDFMLSRAEANGLLVNVDDGKVSVKSPETSSCPLLCVSYGVDLMEFSAELDATNQFEKVESVAWDLQKQSVVKEHASPQSLNKQGDITSTDLSKAVHSATFSLQTPVPLETTALKKWAEAQQLKSGLARIRGHMKFQGNAKAKPGTMIELVGVGKRFNGSAFISSVTHHLENGNWTTEAEFGLSPEWFAERRDLAAPTASGLLPGVEGLHIGVVKKLDQDPDGQYKIQVTVPVLQAETEGVWARLASYYASDGIGVFFIPEIGDEVVLGYFNNDPGNPVVLGSLYSSKRTPPYDLSEDNFTKAIVTRSKLTIEFDEDKKSVTIVTPGQNKITLSDDEQSIKLRDQNDNSVELTPSGISLDSPKSISITAMENIIMKATQSVEIIATADTTIKGLNVTADAQVAFTGKGSATAELSAAGQTTVKGAMVMIN